jgi:hypothetical protein
MILVKPAGTGLESQNGAEWHALRRTIQNFRGGVLPRGARVGRPRPRWGRAAGGRIR